MTAAATSTAFAEGPVRPNVLDVFLRELMPTEGRLGHTLRMALSVAIVVLVAMTLEVPEAVLSCYLVFFASRKDAGSGMLIALALTVAVSFGILLGIVVMQLAADESLIRLFLMLAFTFGGMYMSQASRLGSLATTAGFVFVFALSLLDFVPIPELIPHALSWIWVVVFIPMAVMFLVNALIGPNPAALARKGVATRLRAVAGLLAGEAGAGDTAQGLLEEGIAGQRQLALMARIFSFHSKAEAQRICALSQMSQEMLALALEAESDAVLAADLVIFAKGIEARRRHMPMLDVSGSRQRNAALARMVTHLVDVWDGKAEQESAAASRQEPLLMPDAFSNPVYLQHATKTVIAVFITYAIYTAWNWFEIHTAMITCFYVALGSTGETLHKAALRVTGAMIGGAMGIASIVFLMPHMTDIGHLMLLVAVGSFVAAWVANGSSLIQYMGWQMALAFFLCVLPTITTSFLPSGFAPVFDTAVATDRVLGIIIGNGVVALVFLSFWPVSVIEGLRQALSKAGQVLHKALDRRPVQIAEVWSSVADARRLAGLSIFEVSRLHTRSSVLPHARTILGAMEDAATVLARLVREREHPRLLFGAPRCVKAALAAYETSAGAFVEGAASAIVGSEPMSGTDTMQALATSAHDLQRLRCRLALSPKRAPWRQDLATFVARYARLQADFERVAKVFK